MEQYAHHLLLTFYPFCNEEYLKLPPFSGTYFKKLQKLGLMGVADRNKSLIVPFGEMVDKALSNLVLIQVP